MRRRTFLGMLGGALAWFGLGGRSGALQRPSEEPERLTLAQFREQHGRNPRVLSTGDGGWRSEHGGSLSECEIPLGPQWTAEYGKPESLRRLS